jgi:hypothetical protein
MLLKKRESFKSQGVHKISPAEKYSFVGRKFIVHATVM